MRKTILTALMLATVVPTAAMAQNGELRRDRQDIRQEQRDLRDARHDRDARDHRDGRDERRDVREERRDVRDARQEYREDWRDYRKDNRAVYARGNWRAPFRYHRFTVGYQLRPNYYASRYYITNPGQYRLPGVSRDQRWVRHYDDALLVNVRTGRVIQVINGFYW